MGTFATTTALQTKMVGTPTFDTATLALASACIYDAENEIKKRLGKMYDFSASPFLTTTSIPPVISTLTERLAVGYMYENMARGSKEGYARADRYINGVMENLGLLASGEAVIIGVSGTVIEPMDDNNWAVYGTDNYPPTFNEDDPMDWKVSQDKLDDISDERDE